ncbi:phage gene 29 protein family protein [Tsukamurella tyrosinosolvens]|uniref:phage gene 29 protein family protein n=1 Tax=Tsukamurella tyrosinosolvens TaxID=57704 RepID=UPI002DD43EAA|nr:hypothetical protein [Tsukamurella tyrosinosolvens]MEC4616183.1 hypothetical protein [Tsukamurella tyrosinosolvens]
MSDSEVLLTLHREYLAEPDADDQTARRLIRAAARIADALACMRGPFGELMWLADDDRLKFAWHLARAGADVFDELAIIQRRAIPDRPGQLGGMVDWVSVDEELKPEQKPAVSAVGPVPDLDTMLDRIPFRTRTKITGDFA